VDGIAEARSAGGIVATSPPCTTSAADAAHERAALAWLRPIAAISRAMPADVLTLRLATLDDVPMLRDLIALSAERLSVGHYTAAQVAGALEGTFGVDTQLIADGTYFVAERGGEVAGCGGWSRRATLFGADSLPGRVNDLLDPSTQAAKIRAFFIHPNHARHGVGRALLEHSEAAARLDGFRMMELMSTMPGIAFYEAHGYVGGVPIEHPLSSGETLRLVPMRKVLR
jgi:GNAT superfamily N-acetyltransferase